MIDRWGATFSLPDSYHVYFNSHTYEMNLKPMNGNEIAHETELISETIDTWLETLW